MKIYISIFFILLIFFSFTTPVAISSQKTTPLTKEQIIENLRANNLVKLRLINFKTQYGSYEEYYRQADPSLSEQ